MTGPPRPSARCRRLLRELSRYLDGDLTPARRRTVERHINGCVCCGTMAARLRRTVAACRAEGKRRPPRGVMSRAMVDYLPTTDTLGSLCGICPDCDLMMYRRVSLAKLQAVRGGLDVTMPKASLHIGKSTKPFVNADFPR